MTFDMATAGQIDDRTVIHCPENDLSAARGIFTGVLIGAMFWLVLIVGISFARTDLHVAAQAPAPTTPGAQ